MTRRTLGRLALLVAVLPIAISLRSGFHSDDFYYLDLLDSGRFSLRFFGTNLFGEPGTGGEYRPVVLASFWLNHWISGLSPIGFHVVNASLHVASAAFLASLVRRLFGSRLAATAAGLVFLLHPAQVEPVDWVAGRNDLLTVFFLLAGLAAFLRLRETEARAAGWVALFAGQVLALFCKEYATFFPAVIGAIAIGFGRRLGLRRGEAIAAVGGTLLASALYVAARVKILGSLGGYLEAPDFSIAAAAHRLLQFLDLATLPTWASQYRASPFLRAPWQFAVLAALGAVAIAIARPSRQRGLPALLLAVPWFVLPLLPVTNLWLSERYLYFPIAGLAILVGSAVAWLEERRPALRLAGLAAVGLAVVACGAVHLRKALFWNDTGRIVASLPAKIDELRPNATGGLTVAVRGSVQLLRSAIVWSPALHTPDEIEFLVRNATGRRVRAVLYSEPETIDYALDRAGDVLFLEMTTDGWVDVGKEDEPRWRRARRIGGDLEAAMSLEAKGALLEAFEMLDGLIAEQPFAATQAARIAKRLRESKEGSKRWERSVARALEVAPTDLDLLKLLAGDRDSGAPVPAAVARLPEGEPPGDSPRAELARTFFAELRTGAPEDYAPFLRSIRRSGDDAALALYLGWLAREPAGRDGIDGADVRRAITLLFRTGEDAAVTRAAARDGSLDGSGECARMGARSAWFLDPKPEAPPADAETIPLGTALGLGPDVAKRFLREGWSLFYERYVDPSSPGGADARRWTEGRESTFVFRLPDGVAASSFWMRAGSNATIQPLRVFVNGRKAQEGRIAGRFNAVDVSAPLEQGDGSSLVVRVVVGSCLSPKQRGAGDDDRPLGLWIYAFGVR
jgi:hypothetical protein